jgi:hypothetical protein
MARIGRPFMCLLSPRTTFRACSEARIEPRRRIELRERLQNSRPSTPLPSPRGTP